MKQYIVIGVLALTGIGSWSPVFAAQPEAESEGTRIRVGTFDSRAVAIAFYRSPVHQATIREMMAEYKVAKETGDEERAEALQTRGEAFQALAHRQGFGTAPIDEILERIEDQIPGIAERAGVDMVVSKWDVVYQGDGVDVVDVTLLMVAPFEPDEATLAMIKKDLPSLAPVPISDLE